MAFSKRCPSPFCLFLTASWFLLGAAACGCYFALSRLPLTQLDGIMPGRLQGLDLLIDAVMLPACLVLPAVLLPAGRT